MGTNYYIKNTIECPECGQPKAADYHIGKSSAGWCFSLHVDPENGINDLKDVKRLWAYKTIKDEYGSTISKKYMIDVITDRWIGIRRHEIGSFCIGHGPGTYDYIIGEFS